MVFPADATADHMRVVHFAENFDRKDLTDYDIGMGALAIKREHVIAMPEFARRAGIKYPRLMKLLTYAEHLPDPILADWKAGHPWLTPKMLQNLWEMERERAVEHWAKIKEGYSTDTPEIPAPNPNKGKPKRPPLKDLARMHSQIEECTLPPETKKPMLDLILYVQGLAPAPRLPRQLDLSEGKQASKKNPRTRTRKVRKK